MRSEFVINIILLLFFSFIIKPIYLFLIEKNIQLHVGLEQFGVYAGILNFTLILQVINDFGIQNFTNREISQQRLQGNTGFGELLASKGILSIIYLLFCLLLALIWFPPDQSLKLLAHVAFNQILISGVGFFRSAIAGMSFYRWDSFLSVMDRLILIISGALFLLIPGLKHYLSISLFVWMQTVSLGLTLLICIIVFFSKKPSDLSIHFSHSRVKQIFVACLPFALIYFFNALYAKQDLLLLGRWHSGGDYIVGKYTLVMRFFDAANMVSLAFGGLLLGMFSRQKFNAELKNDFLHFSMKLLLILTVLIVITGFYYAHDINLLVNRLSDPDLDQCMKWTMLAFLPASLSYIYGALYQAIHLEKRLVLIYICIVIVNLLSNYLLIPNCGINGSAISNLVSQSVCLIVLVAATPRAYHLQAIEVAQFISFVILGFCLGHLMAFWGVSFYAFVLLVLPSIVLIAFLLRLFQWDEVRMFVSKLRS
ncbi:MAG TPA: oligosaccharide flippase family protein [Saprospiraceae bacterium]|nr:oligosaccharide flippase family protein [Saprospiraceae bacterium]